MNKLFKTSMAVLMGLALTFTACKKEDSSEDNGSGNGTGSSIPQEQKTTVIYFGGTWCGPCGLGGKPAKEAIKLQAPGKANIISCQMNYSSQVVDPMNNPDANAMAQLFGANSFPRFYFGGADTPFQVIIGAGATTSADAVGAVNAMSARKAKVNAVLTGKEDDGLFVVTANGKFFEDVTSGEYYIAGYLLEDKLKYTQANDMSSEKDIHYNVLRSKFSQSITGEKLDMQYKKDATFSKTLAFYIDPKFVKENLTAVVAIWKKSTDNKWTMSNSTSIKFKQ